MYLSCAVLILAILLKENASAKPRSNVAGRDTAAELAKLIHLVHKLKGKTVADGDQIGGNLDDDTKVSLPDRDEDSAQTVDARFHYIHNPKVLQQYRNNIKTPRLTKSVDDDDNAERSFVMTANNGKRRNAVFRFDRSSKSENTQRNHESLNDPRSLEQDKYFRKRKKPQLNKEDMNHDFDISKEHFNDDIDTNRNRKKGKTKENQDNAWDVITKQYNWEHERKPSDDLPGKRKETRDKFKKNRDEDDSYEKTPKQKRFNKAERHNSDDVKIIKNDRFNDWDKKVFKPEKSYDDWPKNKKSKLNSGEKQITNHKWGSDERNEPDKQNKWDSSERNRPMKKHKWNSGERNKPMKKNKWDSGEHKNPKSKLKQIELSREKPNRNRDSFDEVTTFKTTRKWTREPQDWKDSAAQSQISKPKRSRQSFDSGGGFYGRTPIPFVGKKGIYEET